MLNTHTTVANKIQPTSFFKLGLIKSIWAKTGILNNEILYTFNIVTNLCVAIYKVCLFVDYFIAVRSFSDLMCNLKNHFFLNVLKHTLRICTDFSLFMIMGPALIFFLFIFIMLFALCNSAYFFIVFFV